MEIATTKIIECPRCGSVEFAIEEVAYEACCEHWIQCRQCDWTMGELPALNLSYGGKKDGNNRMR